MRKFANSCRGGFLHFLQGELLLTNQFVVKIGRRAGFADNPVSGAIAGCQRPLNCVQHRPFRDTATGILRCRITSGSGATPWSAVKNQGNFLRRPSCRESPKGGRTVRSVQTAISRTCGASGPTACPTRSLAEKLIESTSVTSCDPNSSPSTAASANNSSKSLWKGVRSSRL